MKTNQKKNTKLTIGRLAEAGGVGLATVRYYQKRGLLFQPDRPPYGGFRVYGDADVERLLRIRGAQKLGFTLAEINVLLTSLEQRECQSVKALIEEKLKNMRSQIRVLKKIHKDLAILGDTCRGNCVGTCQLIDKLLNIIAK